MDADLRRHLEEIFLEIVDLDETEQQQRMSAETPEIAEELRHWLSAYHRAGPLLEQGALAAVPDMEDRWRTATPGRRIGPYRVISELGRGGMGAVYLARRDDPSFPQEVAVKLIKRGMDSEQIIRRFITERRILADLIHPNIARLLDGGSTEDGRPYFVLEHIAGRPITEEAAARGLGIQARLRLFLKVCSAVQHAHQRLIVHRDLKPANILVDVEGEPKLLDFGIAKLLDPASDSPSLTAGGSPLTPDYASPEQSSGEAVTTASDVYSLGVLLFELLTGRNPRKLAAGRSAAKSVDLPFASTTARRRWCRRLKGDLDTILAKALEEKPGRRYATAAALADDLTRHLDHKPVSARRPTRLYRWSRAVTRHRWATAALVSVVLLSGAALHQAFELSQRQEQILREHRRAEALSDFLKSLFSAADPGQSRGASMTAREILDIGARRLTAPAAFSTSGAVAADPDTRAALLKAIGDVYTSLGLYDDGRRMLELTGKDLCRDETSLECVELRISSARALAGQGRYGQSEQHLGHASAAVRDAPGPRQAAARLEALNLSGLIAVETGRFDDAEDFFDQALALGHSTPETPTALIAETLRSVANLEAERGHLNLATDHLREAVTLFRSALGHDHPDTLRAWNDLATVTFQRGHHSKAEELFQRVLRARIQLLGPEHPEVAQAMSNLAVAQEALGRLPEAETSLRRALAIRETSGTVSTLGTARALNSLAAVLRRQKRFDEAAELYGRAVDTLQAGTGPDHPELANIFRGWSSNEKRRGHSERAETLARSALEAARQAFDEPHVEIADASRWLADLIAAAGRLEEAETVYRDAVSIARQLPPEDHPGLAAAWVGLGTTLLGLNRPDDALPWLERGLDLRLAGLPADDWRTAVAQARLGRCWLLLDRHDTARPLLEAARGVLLRRLGPKAQDTVATVAALEELNAKFPRSEPKTRRREGDRKEPDKK